MHELDLQELVGANPHSRLRGRTSEVENFKKEANVKRRRTVESPGGILNHFLSSSAVCLNSLNGKSPWCHLIRENK